MTWINDIKKYYEEKQTKKDCEKLRRHEEQIRIRDEFIRRHMERIRQATQPKKITLASGTVILEKDLDKFNELLLTDENLAKMFEDIWTYFKLSN